MYATCQGSDTLNRVTQGATVRDMRLFERISPGITLLCIVAGAVTLTWGLEGAVSLLVGVMVGAVAFWLDNYGLESE